MLIMSLQRAWFPSKPYVVLLLAFFHLFFGYSDQLAAQTKLAQPTDKASKIASENKEFMQKFVKLSAEGRVETWARAEANAKNHGSNLESRMKTEMANALVVSGVDAVPYLSKLLSRGEQGQRLGALKILCDMDRFVRDDQIPLEALRDYVYAEALNQGGRIDPFAPVDGHRIGKEGFDAVQTAAQQRQNELIGFYARLFTGQLKNELEKRSLEEQIRRWKDAVAKAQIVAKEYEFPEAVATYQVLEVILIERMPESIAPLTDLLKRDKNPYVREELIHIFAVADMCSVRLRKIEVGRDAIAAVRTSLEQGGFAFGYKREQQRREGLKLLLGQFLKDEIPIDPISQWALYSYALESFYGDKTVQEYDPRWIRSAKPEMRKFVSFLTYEDPYFPRWGYTRCGGNAADEVMNPRFRARIARFHSEWEKFIEKERNVSPAP